MSGFGLNWELVLAAVFAGVVGYLVLRRLLSPGAALSVTLVKVAVPFVYFGWIYDGTWSFLDDFQYLEEGRRLLAAEYDPIGALMDPSAIGMLFSMAGGRHILYGWWNLLGQYLFGEYYFAPVFLNVALLFGAAWLFARLLREAGYRRTYIQWAVVFFVLHWELLAWSSFINLKDIVVLFLTLLALLGVLRLRAGDRKLRWIGLLAAVGFLFFWVRFYVPLLIGGTVIGWTILRRRGRGGFRLAAVAVSAGVVLLWLIDLPLDRIEPQNLLYGFYHYLLTPLPWKVADHYSFLAVTASLHLIMFVPAVIGAAMLWQESDEGRLVILYLLGVSAGYAIVPALVGPRQRVQVTFVVLWAQFHALYHLAEVAVGGGVGCQADAQTRGVSA